MGSLTATITRGVEKFSDFLASGFYAVLILSVVAVWTLFSLAILIWPATFTPLAAFAATFKIWCFGYDPLTGKFNFFHLMTVFLDPIFFGVAVGWIWKNQILEFIRTRKSAAVSILMAAIFIVSGTLYIVADFQKSRLGAAGLSEVTPVRVNDVAPEFSLINQEGQTVNGPSAHRVTVVTAFYAHCQHTCPLIFQQAKGALSEIAKRYPNQLEVMMITLDPENDDPATLKDLLKHQGFPAGWNLLTGDSKKVNATLDAYGVTRARDTSGNIGHSNLFYIVDKNKRLSFRINLGGSQEAWLKKVSELLIQE